MTRPSEASGSFQVFCLFLTNETENVSVLSYLVKAVLVKRTRSPATVTQVSKGCVLFMACRHWALMQSRLTGDAACRWFPGSGAG